MTMDWSPIGISMKTASLSILVTFFLGLIVAWFLVKIKNDTAKIILDGIFTLPLVLFLVSEDLSESFSLNFLQ